jgi:hypothetical protein
MGRRGQWRRDDALEHDGVTPERGEPIMEMSNYCAAYEARNFRKFPGWTENAANVRKEKQEVGGKEVEVERQLDDDSILYLHESYIVTDGIYNDENVIFDNVSDEWKSFCHETLGFEVPVYEPIEIPRATESQPPAEAPPAPAATPADTAG